MSESSYTEPEDSTPSRTSADATPPPPLKSPLKSPSQPQQQPPPPPQGAAPFAADASSPAERRGSPPLDAAAYAAVDTTGNSMLHRLEYLHAVQEIARCDVERCIGQYGLSAVLNRYPLEPRTGAKARPRYLHATQTHRAQPAAAAAAPQATSSFAPPTVPRGGRRPLTVQANFTGSTTVRGVGGVGVGAATSDPAVAALLREQKQGNALLRKMLQQTQQQQQQQQQQPSQPQPSDLQTAPTPQQQAHDLLLHTQSSHATVPQDTGTDASALRRQLVDRIESLRQLAGEEKQKETEAAAAAVVAAADGRPGRRLRPDAAAAGAPAGVKVTRQARRRRSLQSRAAAGTAVRQASASDTTAASPSPRGRQQQGGGGGAAGSMFGLPVAVEAAIMASMQGRPRTTTHETATSPLVRSLSALQGEAGGAGAAHAPLTTASGTSPLYRGVDTGVQPEGAGFGTPPVPQVASACTSPHVPFLLPGDAEAQQQVRQREAAAAAFGAHRAARYEDEETEEEEESEVWDIFVHFCTRYI